MNNEYDVVIVGAGAAGLYGALQFDESVNVLLLSKKELDLSNSSLAQGGVASVIDHEHDDESLHFKDTLIAGGYENDKSAVSVLVSEGPKDVLDINKMGVEFDQDDNGEFEFGLEAGHSRNRIVHHKDSTGKEIVDKLILQVKKHRNVDVVEQALVFSLDRAENGFFLGVIKDGQTHMVGAKFCILATGGIGRVYQYTTNSAIATGDGIAFSYLLGAAIKNLHYVQFHPTAFAADKDRERFLISEAVRGEGAVLLNCHGERFVSNYDERAELAPRDVVSKAIILESRKTKSEKFYLDITHKDADFVRNRFPMIYARCLEEGIDITRDKIPVFPCQHYLMGGIGVNLNSRTTIDRLYATGECSHTGVHGKNRLASNSLLEALVFSHRAAKHITNLLTEDVKKSPVGEKPVVKTDGKPLPRGLRAKIREIMQSTYFVIPEYDKIDDAYKEVSDILNEIMSGGYEINSHFVETRSLAIVASVILKEVKDCAK